MRMTEPGFDDVIANERVEIRCLRGDKEHVAVLPDNRPVIVLTAAQ
jgi:glutaredoxin-related protein